MSTRALVTLVAIPLLALAACSREKSDWQSAQAADSPESYEQFIAAHPASAEVTSARERLVQLAEEKDWRVAAEADTAEAYERFLAHYPAGKWAREARTRFDNFAGSAAAPSAASAAGATRPQSAGSAAVAPDVAPLAADKGFGVQLGAFSSPERANEEWKKLATSAGSTLDGLSPRVVVGEAGGKTIYRLQAEVRDEVQARAVCGGLKAANKPCVVVVPPGAP